MNTSTATAQTDPIATAAALGVGARITLSVMSDDYVAVITRALAAVEVHDLEIDTDKVSTFVRGPEDRIATYLRDLVAAAASSGHHLVATVMISRGCPGEVCGTVAPPAVEPPSLERADTQVQAQWSLYPLFDPRGDGDAPEGDHLAPVWAAIERAREAGTYLRSEHFATTLQGDISDVLVTMFDTWLAAAQVTQHVVTHATIVANSPATSGGLR
ncbi:YkoF family thiamine/hydroxymethylpyrimidine-binding protein [Pseudactinotalea terrae]|uniref:YkoF family thiamine/hydroxymethylpyrimidine-binding protein n=1 Tax=Pseudactinotalea terrae TaxID=1743262 RepID=UPI0012E2F543|nr:YkoF family thiamine/hydroxymethylpyrimidine-binding protein [Pseudactinotalea terrae]